MMSHEEQRARADLESEIEREIEEELKDGVCHLALGLHRLYLKRKKSYSNTEERKSDETNEVSTVVCITTRTVGESMMQVYESQTRVLATKPSTDHKQDVKHGMGSQANKRSAGKRFKNKQLELGWKY